MRGKKRQTDSERKRERRSGREVEGTQAIKMCANRQMVGEKEKNKS